MSVLALPLPCSVGDLLALAEREVPPGLVSPAAWQKLHRIADPLPPIAHEAGLEIRLGAGDGRVDLEVCLRAARAHRRRLADAIARAPRDARGRGWERIRAFLEAWAWAGSPLDASVHAGWIEFDADGPGPPEPFLIFAFDRDRLYAGGTAPPERLLPPLLTGLDRLAGGLEPGTAAAVEQCVRGLPANAALRHAAVRPTAAGDVARLVVELPWRRLPQLLARLEWPGDLLDLRETLEPLCPDTLVHMVNLDVLPDGLGPRLGIEILHGGAPATSARWQRLFDNLESLGACAPERRAAIRDWGGQRLGPPLGPGLLGVRRDLLVKAVYAPGEPLAAKAYLAFAPRLRLGAVAA